MRYIFVLSVLFALSLTACGNKSGGDAPEGEPAAKAKAVFACQAPSQNEFNCVEWHGGAYDEAAAKAECTANRGSFAGPACPTAKRVATCKRHVGTPSETHEHWYAGSTTVNAETIATICVGAGAEAVKY